MCGQQVLHNVQTFSTVEVCWLARQDVEFVCSNSLLEAFATLTRCGRPGNPLQFDDFGAFTGFLRNVITGDFTAQHVIRRDVADYIAFVRLTVQRDHRNFRLVCHFNGVTYGVRIGWVDQQDFGATNG